MITIKRVMPYSEGCTGAYDNQLRIDIHKHDFKRLAERLRSGNTSNISQATWNNLADFLEGKIKKPSGRPKSPMLSSDLFESYIYELFTKIRNRFGYETAMQKLLSRYGRSCEGRNNSSICPEDKAISRKQLERIITNQRKKCPKNRPNPKKCPPIS